MHIPNSKAAPCLTTRPPPALVPYLCPSRRVSQEVVSFSSKPVLVRMLSLLVLLAPVGATEPEECKGVEEWKRNRRPLFSVLDVHPTVRPRPSYVHTLQSPRPVSQGKAPNNPCAGAHRAGQLARGSLGPSCCRHTASPSAWLQRRVQTRWWGRSQRFADVRNAGKRGS